MLLYYITRCHILSIDFLIFFSGLTFKLIMKLINICLRVIIHMISLLVNVHRGNIIESKHKVVCSIKDIKGKSVFANHNKELLIYPRSAIKIFQAIPFIKSKAHTKLNLNQKMIAMSCASHNGEVAHLKILNAWINNTKIKITDLKCGIHNPLNLQSSNKLLLNGITPNQLHNNCAGKHLGMISGCIANNLSYKNYTHFLNPYQKMIRQSLQFFMDTKIKKNYIGVDGCSAPQYAFPISSIASSMINLIKQRERENEYSKAIKTILLSINKYPKLIGGTNNFDSNIIKITKGRFFCKGGAEGVLLFADFKKKIGGVIKVLDGNERAIPPIAMKIFKKLNLLSNQEKKLLNKWENINIYNHARLKIGKIAAKIK